MKQEVHIKTDESKEYVWKVVKKLEALLKGSGLYTGVKEVPVESATGHKGVEYHVIIGKRGD